MMTVLLPVLRVDSKSVEVSNSARQLDSPTSDNTDKHEVKKISNRLLQRRAAPTDRQINKVTDSTLPDSVTCSSNLIVLFYSFTLLLLLFFSLDNNIYLHYLCGFVHQPLEYVDDQHEMLSSMSLYRW